MEESNRECYKKLKTLAKTFQKNQARWEADHMALASLQLVAEADKAKNKELEEKLEKMQARQKQLQMVLSQ